mgnify:CR=1 FL=1
MVDMAALQESPKSVKELLKGLASNGTIIKVGGDAEQGLEEVVDVPMEIWQAIGNTKGEPGWLKESFGGDESQQG